MNNYETSDLDTAAAIEYLSPGKLRGLEQRSIGGKKRIYFIFKDKNRLLNLLESDDFKPFKSYFQVRNKLRKSLRVTNDIL